MDYERIYREFIADRRKRETGLAGYRERHHIQPRCIGGDDDPANLIKLTAGDHFFAHLLLAKIYGGKLWYALNALVAGHHIGDRKKDRAFTIRARRHYVAIKDAFAREHSLRMKGVFAGAAHPMYGKPCSPVALEKLRRRIAEGFNPMDSVEAREKVSLALKGRIITPEARAKLAAHKKGKRLPPETCAKMSASRIGKTHSPETVAKLKAANTGKKRTAEQVAAMRERLTGRKLSPEHVEKLKPHLAGLSRFRGKKHSPESRARMAAVCAARREYKARFGGNIRTVSIEQMRQAGIAI